MQKMNTEFRLQRHSETTQDPELASLHPVLARVLQHRHVHSTAAIEYNLQQLLDYSGLHGLAEANQVFHQAFQDRRNFLIVGDYDADGATATALAIHGLRAMGATHVSYLVPNRFDYGYGLTPELVEVARDLEPDVIITVDNGIASIEGVAAARNAGIEVIVTDHHLPGEQLPDATAILNPNQPQDQFPSKMLAGVGVMFYVLIALRKYLQQQNWFTENKLPVPNLAQWLDLVALGTVADVVPLDQNNRILVEQGLRRIRSGQTLPGILALIQVAGKDYRRITASDIGFIIGPRLNAAGRLEDMSVGIECLLSTDQGRANELAATLDNLNRQRRDIEADMRTQAFAHLDETLSAAEQDQIGICLYHPDWHQGVVGLVAARVKEKLHRPVIAFADDKGTLKGSARSIPGLHIRDVLALVDSQHPGMITKFGGHAMAAGLSMPLQHLEEFSRAYDGAVSQLIEPELLQPVIHSDGELCSEEINQETASILQNSGPWGQGFPEPVFDGVFRIVQRRILKEKHLKLMLCLPDDDSCLYDAIVFNIEPSEWPDVDDLVHIAYRLDINYFRGQENLQLMIVHRFEPE